MSCVEYGHRSCVEYAVWNMLVWNVNDARVEYCCVEYEFLRNGSCGIMRVVWNSNRARAEFTGIMRV